MAGLAFAGISKRCHLLGSSFPNTHLAFSSKPQMLVSEGATLALRVKGAPDLITVRFVTKLDAIHFSQSGALVQMFLRMRLYRFNILRHECHTASCTIPERAG